MAGKFINQDKKIMLDTIADNMKTVLNNPYYLFNDKRGSVAQYYNINNTKTTLDEATRANYSELGPNSPIRYNLIHDMVIYGIDKVSLDMEVGDNGLEANDITGDAIILPNTITPYPGDFFTLDQIGKPYLFKITNVNQNTLDTGSIMYQVNYILAYTDLHCIDKQVVEEYNMMINNIGTNFKSVIRSTKYDLIKEIEEYTTKLKDYYISLFYNKEVQTFTFLNHGILRVTDIYLIEFIKRNKILKGSSEYIYVTQQLFLPDSFAVDYDRTIFAALEDKDRVFEDTAKVQYIGNLIKIQQKLSLLYAFPEDYYYVEYKKLYSGFFTFDIFNGIPMLDRILKNEKTGQIMLDVMIKYFHNEPITLDDLKQIKAIDYCNNEELYYGIPITIFCLEQIAVNILS